VRGLPANAGGGAQVSSGMRSATVSMVAIVEAGICAICMHRAQEKNMVTPVVPNQFEVGKNKIVHKPTKATFSFDTGHTTFKSVDWGRADEQSSGGEDHRKQDYRKDDVMRVARQLLSRLPR
jgi:hypothetical protein